MYVKNICHTNQVPTMCTPLPYICLGRMLNGVQSINFFEKKDTPFKGLENDIFFSKRIHIVYTFVPGYTLCTHYTI